MDIVAPALTVIAWSLVWPLTFINVIETADGEFRANALSRLDTTKPVNQNHYFILILQIFLLNNLIYHCNKS